MAEELNQSVLMISEWAKHILIYKQHYYLRSGKYTHDELIAESFKQWFSANEIEVFKRQSPQKFILTTLHGYELQRVSYITGVPRTLLDIAFAKAVGEIYHEQFGKNR